MSLGALHAYKLDSVYIVESILSDNQKKRGTCFSISPELIFTANHVVSAAKEIQIYVSSDDYASGKYISADLLYSNEILDVAMLRLSEKVLHCIDLYATNIGLDCEVKSCGYPIEKEHYHAPIAVKVTNVFSHLSSREYSFEVSQSNTVSSYRGMSGSPVIYDGRCIGILLVQQGGNTLYSVSAKDILDDDSICNILGKENINYVFQEGISYNPPEHPTSPFKYCINCNLDLPGIKGVDIGFTLKKWNVNKFSEAAYDWIIDYCLSYKDKAKFKGSSRSLFKFARAQYPVDDLHALGDLCLHMAIRESYNTIPVMNKVFDAKNRTFSCTHAVLNFDNVELWLGASSVNKNIEEAVKAAIENINYIIDLQALNIRLYTLSSELDDSWPHKEKLERLADPSLDLDERFDKIIIPVFIMHDSEVINDYDKDRFLNLFQAEILYCRSLLKDGLNKSVVNLIDLRVFYFPVSSVIELNNALLEELNS